MREHVLLTALPNFVLVQLRRGQNVEVDRVVEVVTVIGDFVRQIRNLRFQGWKPARALVLLQAFANFEGQIQSGKIGIGVFQQFDHPQTLPVVLETAVIAHAFGQDFFAGMPEGRVAEIVGQGDRFRQIFIEGKGPGDGPANGGNFNRMGQPRSQVIAGAVQKNLGFVFEPPKCARMNDPGAVALKFSPIGVALLRIFSSSRFTGLLRERSQGRSFGRFHLLTRFPTDVHVELFF